MSTLVWLTNNLRVANNPALVEAKKIGAPIKCIYIFEKKDLEPKNYSFHAAGKLRKTFLEQTLEELRVDLARNDISLEIMIGETLSCLAICITQHDIRHIISAYNPDHYWQRYWQLADQRWREMPFTQVAANTLLPVQHYSSDILQDYYGGSFSRFRKRVQKNGLLENLLENLIDAGSIQKPQNFQSEHAEYNPLTPGEKNAKLYIQEYFSSQAPLSYKTTRNALDGRFTATGFSVALANGLVCVQTLLGLLKSYEQQHGRNDSTEWIEFELLWRDYFYGYAKLHDARLFYFSGITHKAPLTSLYAQRLRMWCAGNTPWPLVNACMRQLNATGFMSNRGRQIVASCLVNELNLDWRYGAAYFQQQLLDYDVASNWGNWQYIAGVGPDPRGGRHFNIAKQTSLYDPEHRFINTWCKPDENLISVGNLDGVDAADWPT